MAVGAVYQIIANQGKMDNLLTANKFLQTRIQQIVCAKKRLANGNTNADVLPSLSDIEKTHILFVNAKYKPFVTTAMEYYKQSYGAQVAYGSTNLQIQIPQFGDFFADMALRVTISAVTTTAGNVPVLPGPIGQVTVAGTDPRQLITTTAGTGGQYYRFTQQYTDLAENLLTPTIGNVPGSVVNNYVRYCEYPGVRLFAETRFEVSAARLDVYSSLAQIVVAKKSINPGKVNAWKKLVGQEVPIEAYSDPVAYAGTNGYTGLMGSSVIARNGMPSAITLPTMTVSYKTTKQYMSGLQTPQAAIPETQLWVPLWFWFNTDVHLAIPSAAIPFNNRYIKFNLAKKEDIISLAPGNLYYSVAIDQFTTSGVSVSTPLASIVNSTERSIPQLADNSIISGGDIQEMSLFINNLFIDPDVHEMYIRRIGFSMIRIYLEQSNDQNTTKQDILMQQFKYPVEFFFVGGRPVANLGATNSWRDWHRFQYINIDQVDNIGRSYGYYFVPNAAPPNGDAAVWDKFPIQRRCGTDNIINATETIDSMRVYVSGVDLFEESPNQFYRDYVQYTFGCETVNTQVDDGILMVNFSLFPWIYQPSGHFNVSRTNQFYVTIVSAGAAVSGQSISVYFCAKAINFLLIADGSCVLRYTA